MCPRHYTSSPIQCIVDAAGLQQHVCLPWQVFDEVSDLVTSILDGYNVCIMAYGQTGSGKTYTIEGPAEDPGVNSRALAELFRSADERSTGFGYAFSASVLEIYNEQIFDLLAGSRDSGEQAG
eukprot:GHRQ01012332.1.p4 GENE.GHRQ01012332.1~~GHRQ01012332.1.p4  ORF type:complete len:123 (+),score=48.19 GHRQ01012332.1:505-873(+)